MSLGQISLIIPMHNDAEKVEGTIKKTRKFLEQNKIDAEIIITEDSSTDGTEIIAKKMTETTPNLLLLHETKKLGKGLAIEKAIQFAHNEVVMFMDADLATDLTFIPALLKQIELGASISMGSRLHPQSKVKRKLSREIASKFFNLFVHLLFGVKDSDMQCGFKAFRKSDVAPFFNLIKQKKWAWDTELIIFAHRVGLKVVEIPIVWDEGTDTKVKILNNTIEHIRGLSQLRWRLLQDVQLKTRLNQIKERYPKKEINRE